jgi:hypothetical protein
LLNGDPQFRQEKRDAALNSIIEEQKRLATALEALEKKAA